MNKHAQALGRLGKGKPKKFTADTIKQLTDRLTQARKRRWLHRVK